MGSEVRWEREDAGPGGYVGGEVQQPTIDGTGQHWWSWPFSITERLDSLGSVEETICVFGHFCSRGHASVGVQDEDFVRSFV